MQKGDSQVSAGETEELVAALVACYADTGRTVAATRLAGLDLETALAVQQAVTRRLGESVPVSKVGVLADGTAIAAPIHGALSVASGGRLAIPARGLVGIEVEVAVRLRTDVPADGDVAAAIEGYLCGIEVIGTRLDDRRAAGPWGTLADNLITAGYAAGSAPWTAGPDVDGIDIEVFIDGARVHAGKATHPFGGVLAPIAACARAPGGRYGWLLRAGTIVTTGTLCAVVPVSGPCTITARLAGTHEVELALG